jgi:hypothetical protein
VANRRIELRQWLDNLHKDRYVERWKEKFLKDVGLMIREVEDKLSELGVPRDMLREHLRGLGVA